MGRRIIQSLQFTILISLFLVLNFSCSDVVLMGKMESTQKVLFTDIYPNAEGEWIESIAPTLKWQAVSGAERYELQIALSETAVPNAEIIAVESSEHTISLPLEKGDEVFWRVRAADSASRYTVWSDVFFFTVPKYFIGDEGPAGGLVFYRRDLHEEGWHYLEVAPVSTEWSNIPWGIEDLDYLGADRTAVGEGQNNTNKILAVLGPGNEYAAQLCDN
jgi:hypothetical protein